MPDNKHNKKRDIKLQRLLAAALLFVLLPAVAIQAWFSYRTAHDAAATFQEQLASEVSARIFDKVLQFFEVPNHVVRYNAEQFRAGTLDIEKPRDMQRNFLLQLNQQNWLTFVSVGTINGDYYAASRPPLGQDRALRFVQSTQAEGRKLTHYRVNANNQPGAFISQGDVSYDPRRRPWFKAAMGQKSPRWYGAYRYAPYDAMGIGMAVPLHNRAGEFVGVMTADVALVQLSHLLASITRDLGGTAFLFDDAGGLLATSTQEEIYALKGNQTVRLNARDSANPLIRAASKLIHEKTAPLGRTVALLGEERYLLDWQQYRLPDGPTVTMASILPRSQFEALPQSLFLNLILFSATIFIASLVLILFVSKWVAKPLVELAQWATQLGRGEWREMKQKTSPIAEVDSLSSALHFMAESVKYHTDNLEKEVAARTVELELANNELAKRSNTDGLTGLANRRYFDEVLAQEIARARRLKEPLALIMLDVDYFKEYNDHYGHVAGDDCLIRVAGILKDNTRRPGDLAARYGGEEFAVIAAHNDAQEAMALANLLRQKIEQARLPHPLSPSAIVTASFGIAVFIPDEQHGATQLIDMADKALYRAKDSGRNCVIQDIV